MAKLRGTTFSELDKILGDKFSVTIGNNTAATRMTDGGIAITLHKNKIAELYRDDVIMVSLAGWDSVTTRERVNQFLPNNYRIFQKSHTQYLSKPDGSVEQIDAYEWITVNRFTRPAKLVLKVSS